MSGLTHPASTTEAKKLWPAVRAAHIIANRDEFMRYHEGHPEWVRVSRAGDVLVLGRWRAHLDLLAIRGLWAPIERMGPLLDQVRLLAESWGRGGIVSPLVAESLAGPYREAGMADRVRLVAFTRAVGAATEPRSLRSRGVRLATADDLPALVDVDGRCFDAFWLMGPEEFARSFASERLTVYEHPDGGIVGYAACALSGASVTISRLAVLPETRRCGIATALLAECVSWSREVRALGVSLCTQEENLASRGLYVMMGFVEMVERYVLLTVDAHSAR